MKDGPVLITGCSTGIGRATAIHLARRGWTVYASARRLEAIADLAGCEKLELDVTDEASMVTAVGKIVDQHGAIGGLVNNAGYGIHGAFETTNLDEARQQFETNFFGLARLTQLVLPSMRGTGSGRIVNISSMGGKLTFPGGGYYHASKHAVEALSDALRFEVAPFGVRVIVIEPGAILTEFATTAIGTVEHPEDASSPYASFNQLLGLRIQSAYEGTMARFAASPPEAVAKVVERALASKKPRTRYLVTAGARILVNLRRALPDRAWDAILRSQYPQPGR